MSVIVKFVLLIGWIGGIVIANGFWSTALALFLPLWSWYLVVEMAMKVAGWVA